jgi:LysR family transcriptional regulator for bpeEF and oprC
MSASVLPNGAISSSANPTYTLQQGPLFHNAERCHPRVNQRLTIMQLDLFRGVVPFVAVAEERSFRRAAERLGVSPAAVSKAVKTLEEELGHSLLARNSRAVVLTREGELLFERCRAAVAAVQGVREALEGARRLPEGELVVSVPFIMTQLLASALALLRVRYPRLTFRVLVTDRLSRLNEEAVDVAVRVGTLADSSLVARRIRRTRLLTVASPRYLARRGTPGHIEDLDGHDCLVGLAPQGRPYPWMFASGTRLVTPTLVAAHGPTLIDAALAGLGITQGFDFMVEGLVREGRLVTLLPDEVADGPDVHAVCAPGRRAAPRIRAAFEALVDSFSATS